jgi:hypothetical protein
MQTTRKKLLVTLVLMTVAVTLAWPTLTSAGVRTSRVSASSDASGAPGGRPNGMTTQGEPDQPDSPAPVFVVIHLTAQPGEGDPHSRIMPPSMLFMWIGRIWAVQYGLMP